MRHSPGLSTALALTLTTACGDPSGRGTEGNSDGQSATISSASFPTSDTDTSGTSSSATDSSATAEPTSGANASGATDSTTSTTANTATDSDASSDSNATPATATSGDITATSSDITTTTTTTTGDPPDDTGDVECNTVLDVIVRDFSLGHPDFEDYGGDSAYKGLVNADLGPDSKPVYAHPGATPQTSGPDAFKQWYNDTPGVNQTFPMQLDLTEIQPGLYQFASEAFFPVDDKGFGNEGLNHNFAFTTEIHTQFIYNGGEKFTFTGDDDLWMFINKKLAIDLGGLHPPLNDTVDLDAAAGLLGIVPGQTYTMDIFHAERHSDGSNFRIDTTIGCFVPQ